MLSASLHLQVARKLFPSNAWIAFVLYAKGTISEALLKHDMVALLVKKKIHCYFMFQIKDYKD